MRVDLSKLIIFLNAISQANSRLIKDHGTPFAKHATRVQPVNIDRVAATPAREHAQRVNQVVAEPGFVFRVRELNS